MHIVIADQLPSSAVELLRSVPGWSVDARSGRTAEELTRDLATADALVVRSATKATAPIIAAASNLKAIARAGTGVDNVDVGAATELRGGLEDARLPQDGVDRGQAVSVAHGPPSGRRGPGYAAPPPRRKLASKRWSGPEGA